MVAISTTPTNSRHTGKTPWEPRGRVSDGVGSGWNLLKITEFGMISNPLKILWKYVFSTGFSTEKYAPLRQNTPLVRVIFPVRTEYVFCMDFVRIPYVFRGTGWMMHFINGFSLWDNDKVKKSFVIHLLAVVLPRNLHKDSFEIKDTNQHARIHWQQSFFLFQIASHSRSSVESSKLYQLSLIVRNHLITWIPRA